MVGWERRRGGGWRVAAATRHLQSRLLINRWCPGCSQSRPRAWRLSTNALPPPALHASVWKSRGSLNTTIPPNVTYANEMLILTKWFWLSWSWGKQSALLAISLSGPRHFMLVILGHAHLQSQTKPLCCVLICMMLALFVSGGVGDSLYLLNS